MADIWFRRKRRGYGWFPVSWEGWLVMLVYGAALAGLVVPFLSYLEKHPEGDAWVTAAFVVGVVVLSACLFWVCHEKSSKGFGG